MSLVGRRFHSITLHVEPPHYLAGWRAERGTLFLAALSEARVGDEVAARLGILGQPIRATVFGTVGLVRRIGRPSLPPGVELRLDQRSLPGAQFLALAARGEPLTFRERAPRFVVARPLRMTPEGGEEREVTTLNLSVGGGAVTWPAGLPDVGQVVTARAGGGFFAPSVRTVVCWTTPPGASRELGLRVVGEGRGARAWAALAAEAAQAGGRVV